MGRRLDGTDAGPADRMLISGVLGDARMLSHLVGAANRAKLGRPIAGLRTRLAGLAPRRVASQARKATARAALAD